MAKKTPNQPPRHGGPRPNSGRPKIAEKSVPISAMVPADTLERLIAKAQRKGISKSEAIREAIERWA